MGDLEFLVSPLLEAIVGRSFWFDSLTGLSLRNELIKAVPVTACFLACWCAGDEQVRATRRRVLLVTLLAAVLAAGISRFLSESNSCPRPYVFATQVYRFDAGQLTAMPHQPLPEPRDNASRLRYEALRDGRAPGNYFGSFPSDHASMFLTLALGICLAWPALGSAAMLWTWIIILLPRVLLGMHSPADILAGLAIGLFCLTSCKLAADYLARKPLERLVQFTHRAEGLTCAALFVALFEISLTFDHVSSLAQAMKRHLLG